LISHSCPPLLRSVMIYSIPLRKCAYLVFPEAADKNGRIILERLDDLLSPSQTFHPLHLLLFHPLASPPPDFHKRLAPDTKATRPSLSEGVPELFCALCFLLRGGISLKELKTGA